MKLVGKMEVKDNALYIGGISAENLAKEYGTPLYVFDEELIRDQCRRYYDSFKVNENNNKVAYAGKAFLTLAMCKIIKEEGLYLDVVSGGELYTAWKSGFPMDKIYFHGNNKTLEEIEMGIELHIGSFVADNLYEVKKINEVASKKNKIQKILLRVTPGIEAHTHDYIKTGQIDSKFGFTVLNDEIIEVVKEVKKLGNVKLLGLHCHIGSQIFETKPYEDEVEIMLALVKKIKQDLDVEITELDLGGGFGIYYKEGDSPKKIEEFCEIILNKGNEVAERLNIKLPTLVIEPGRSIVGNAGTTLYTVGAIKDIPNVRKYVSVDGGMTDNIRPALYNAEYECVLVNKIKSNSKEVVTISGKCCESGDILLNDVKIPQSESGDILAVLATGAYCYSMSNNYNKIPKSAVVMVKDGKGTIVCRKQSYEDIIANEVLF